MAAGEPGPARAAQSLAAWVSRHISAHCMVHSLVVLSVPPAVPGLKGAACHRFRCLQGQQPARAPLVEFPQPSGATHASLCDDASLCAAACPDGSVCLFDVAQARLRWQSAGAAGQGAVAGIALFSRMRGSKVLVAYRWDSRRCHEIIP